jgi:excisionase family DNA binding protein
MSLDKGIMAEGDMNTSEIVNKREAIVADGLLSVEEAKAFLRVSRSTLYSLMDTNQIAYVKLGRSRRVPRRALIEFACGGLVAG